MRPTINNRCQMCSRTINRPSAFHLRGRDVKNIAPCRGKGQPLPETLVIPPGTYHVHGFSYRLAKEGLYRFLYPGIENQQRIVYRRDPWAFISALSWLSSHGNRDNEKSINCKMRIALREKLIVTCGDMSDFGKHFLSEHGIASRRVATKTLDESNNYDTGHQLAEVKLDGKWILADMDVKVLFRRGGRRLSLLEAIEAVAQDDYQLEPLAQAAGIAVSNFTEKNYDYGLWMETRFFGQPAIRAWYRHIMGIPIIHHEGKSYFTARTDLQGRKVQRRWKDLTYLPRADFIKRFYGEK